MLWNLGLDLALGAILVATWYWGCLRMNRRRSTRILYWIDQALAGSGRISGIEWLSASRFLVRLRLQDSCFRCPAVIVRLAPRELPFHWLMNRLRKTEDTATFEANLPLAPTFNMDVHTQHWRTGARPDKMPKSGRWTTETIGPFVITNRRDWQRDVVCAMDTMTQSRGYQFVNVSFRKTSPHFSATLPLEVLRPRVDAQPPIFDVLKELATGSSSARF